MGKLRRRTFQALVALVLVIFASTNMGPKRLARWFGGARQPARLAVPALTSNGRPRCCGQGTDASLVWVMLGDPHFQPYLLESVRQARVFNPRAYMFVVVDPAHFTWNHAWNTEMADMKVNVVNYTMLTDPFWHEFSKNYQRLWDELGRKLGAMMQPTINGRSNMDFTQVTMTRLVAVLNLMKVYNVERVVHIENDQMTYGSIQDVKDAADACGVRLAMTKVGVRLAPATVYARDAAALEGMLAFINDAISRGVERAIEIAEDRWVTDMSLPAVYFKRHAAAGHVNVSVFPNSPDGTCLNTKSAMIYDGLGLGTWCCGSFEWPRKHKQVILKESSVPYWEHEFEWRVVDGLRRPFWNGSAVFNLHMHSKQLHLFRSTDAEMPQDLYEMVPLHN